jgi:hypothetical protein
LNSSTLVHDLARTDQLLTFDNNLRKIFLLQFHGWRSPSSRSGRCGRGGGRRATAPATPEERNTLSSRRRTCCSAVKPYPTRRSSASLTAFSSKRLTTFEGRQRHATKLPSLRQAQIKSRALPLRLRSAVFQVRWRWERLASRRHQPCHSPPQGRGVLVIRTAPGRARMAGPDWGLYTRATATASWANTDTEPMKLNDEMTPSPHTIVPLTSPAARDEVVHA